MPWINGTHKWQNLAHDLSMKFAPVASLAEDMIDIRM